MRSMGWLLLVGVAVSLAALGDASAQGPIKIRFLSPLSGAIAAAGKDMYSGCELFWQESGWQMAGRKVEVVLEDNEGNPATTLTKARKLVESDKVHLLMGASSCPTSPTRWCPTSNSRASPRCTRSIPPTTSPSASGPSG
jgi:hypothetical protein